MKKLLILTAFCISIASASAQGVLSFKNLGSGANGSVNAAIFSDPSLSTRLAGSGFSAQLYAGPDAGSLAAVGPVVTFNTGVLAGYFASTPNVAVPSVPAGSAATVQVRAWNNAGGTITTYEAATLRGVSNTLTIGLVDANSPNFNTLVGLQSFGLVPEPSVFALAIVGAGLFLMRKRK